MQRWKELEKAVTDLLDVLNVPYRRMANYRCFKCGQVMNRTAKDFPDFYCYTIHLYIECKTGEGKLTKGQELFKKQVENAGDTYIVCKNNLDLVLAYFKNKGFLI